MITKATMAMDLQNLERDLDQAERTTKAMDALARAAKGLDQVVQIMEVDTTKDTVMDLVAALLLWDLLKNLVKVLLASVAKAQKDHPRVERVHTKIASKQIKK
jgi:hypothetical protein